MTLDVTSWLYPINPDSGYVFIEPGTGEESPTTPENLLQSIEQRPDVVDSFMLSTGYRTMRPGDAIWVYAAGAGRQMICALGRAIDIYEDPDDGWRVDLMWDADATRALMGPHPLRRDEFLQFPQRAAIRADDHAQAVFARWLRQRGRDLRYPDENLALSTLDARLRVLTNVVRRQGQHTFRGRLLKIYGDHCVVTGPNPREVLDAAHIEPYLGVHSNDVRNGLLLRTDLHTLFDLHLIGVDSANRLVVSSRLDGTPYSALHGTVLRTPNPKKCGPAKQSLAAHLSRLQK
ncbi:HNH endonuclease signature motif containing protein [Dactylosporangium sp. NPDC049742]|uniref:HNH endonuclease n=1 Tax=Dactylosporangium sp. NPDC049742 TaxID=3154737 RepID=UPI00343709B5